MARLADVAKAAGVSTATASRALSRPDMVASATRERILAAADEVGFRLNASARALTTGRTGLAGVVVPTLTNPFFPPIVTGVQREMETVDGNVVLAVSEHSASSEQDLVGRLASQVDGLVLVNPIGDEAAIREFAQRLPVVTVDRKVRGVPAVICDTATGVADLVTHLVERGHRRVAYLGGPPGSWMDERRRAAAEKVLARSGGELVVLTPAPPQIDAGFAAAEHVAADRGISAVIAYSSFTVLGLLMGLNYAGLRVPEDVSLVASDDLSPLGTIRPGITALRVPLAEAGATASRLVRTPPSTARTVRVRPELVLRDSVR